MEIATAGATTRKLHWAPNDVMLQLLTELEEQPEKADFRYVLSLLLVRRRVLRVEDTETDAAGQEIALLYCPRNEASFRVTTVQPTREREQQIQQELSNLLTAGS